MSGSDRDLALHIEITGDGTPVVFTHGWLNTGEVWSGVVAELGAAAGSAPASVRAATWDLRGHGRSGVAPTGQYGRDYALADLSRVIEAVGRPAILVGHSLGGYLSLAHAILSPADVSGLVLVAAGPGFRSDDSRNQWNANVREMAAARDDVPDGQVEITEHVDAVVIDRLAEISVPVITLVGERDKRFLASADVFDKHLDVRQRLTVPGAGHMLHAKQPAVVAGAVTSMADIVAGGDGDATG
ncbi:MAG: alpha/beta hydrolase [Actinomycetota bacterium]